MINKIIDFYKDPKKRSMIALPLYFLFFLFIFTVFRFKPPMNKKISNVSIIENIQKNYASTYDIKFTNTSDEPNKNMTITSKRYNNKEVYKLIQTNENYFREDDILYCNHEEVKTFSINLSKLTQEYFEQYIKKGKEIYKTEYNDGKVEKLYEIPLSSFSEMYDEKKDNNGVVSIKILSKGNEIEKINVDMKEYYFVEMEINYFNYGKIKEDDVLNT